MDAKRLADGRLLVPARAEGDDGMIGDGMVTIGPGDPGYDEWIAWFDQVDQIDPDQDGQNPGQLTKPGSET